MIDRACARSECDVLILTRGGGSLEDLWPFNEVAVARAIHRCRIPLVSAVGHEIDYTIADFVADRRAATPSAAAELVSPDRQEWLARLQQLLRRLEQRLHQAHSARAQRLDWLEKRLQQRHPGQQLRQQFQRLDELERRYRLNMVMRLGTLRSVLQAAHTHLLRLSPAARRRELEQRRQVLARRLQRAMQTLLTARRQALSVQCRALDAISPLATLQRGYAIVRRTDGSIVRQAQDVAPGTHITARLARGQLLCTVDTVEETPGKAS
jgi:exodeoxyribonuclease VII large subunit